MVPNSYANDVVYNQLSPSKKWPTFASSEIKCPLKTIEVYKDSGYNQQFTGDDILTLTISPQFTVEFTYNEPTEGFAKELYFKMLTGGLSDDRAKVSLVMCGAETIQANDTTNRTIGTVQFDYDTT